MTGKTHAIIGLNTLWLIPITQLDFTPLVIPVAAIAALLPDLDASESMAKNLSVSFGTSRHRISIKPFWIFAVVLSKIFKHRGWLHSWVAILAVAAASFAIFPPENIVYPVIIVAAYTSHLLSDALTKHGIQFFLPINTPVSLLPRFLRVRTGGVIDTLLFVGGAMTFAWFVFRQWQSGWTPFS